MGSGSTCVYLGLPVSNGTIPCLLVLSGVCWYYLVSSGTIWCLSGTIWCLLVLSGVLWCYLVSTGTIWCLLILSGVSGVSGTIWCLVLILICLSCPNVMCINSLHCIAHGGGAQTRAPASTVGK